MVEFKDSSHDRGGAEKDTMLLKALLPHLGFKVTTKLDLTKQVTVLCLHNETIAPPFKHVKERFFH